MKHRLIFLTSFTVFLVLMLYFDFQIKHGVRTEVKVIELEEMFSESETPSYYITVVNESDNSRFSSPITKEEYLKVKGKEHISVSYERGIFLTYLFKVNE